MDSIPTDNHPSINRDPIQVKITTDPPKPKTLPDPPLVSLQVTNPVTYLKSWWKKLIGNEGVKLTLQIKPVTAFILAAIICGAGFGVGRLTVPEPLLTLLPLAPSPTPSPTPNPWIDAAFTGKLQSADGKYFLVTTSSQASNLQAPQEINLAKLIGKRILAVGSYNKTTKTMKVTDTTDLEILPASPLPLPTVTPTPSPVPAPTPL
jgi:hypothetical protein